MSHIPNQKEHMDPHRVQTSFPVASLGYSKGDLHFSSLRLVILIITKAFPFLRQGYTLLGAAGLLGMFCCWEL